MRLVVNGRKLEIVESINLEMFLKSLQVKSHFVAVGYNGVVIDKSELSNIFLKEGDIVEIVRPVGGG